MKCWWPKGVDAMASADDGGRLAGGSFPKPLGAAPKTYCSGRGQGATVFQAEPAHQAATWHSTVRTEMNSRRVTSALVKPWPTNPRTSPPRPDRASTHYILASAIEGRRFRSPSVPATDATQWAAGGR